MRAIYLLLLLVACSRDTSTAERERVGAVPVVSAPVADARDAEPAGLINMLRDRPLMAAELAARPAVRAWIMRRMRGEQTGTAVGWDAAAPRSLQPAEHIQPQAPGDTFLLRVTDHMTGLDQVTAVMFELINMEGAPEMADLWGRATARTIERAAYANAMTRLEHRAMVQLKKVLGEFQIVPGHDDDLLRGALTAPEDFDAFRAWIAKLRSYDPERYWADAYDTIK